MIENTKLITESKNGKRYKHPCTLEYKDGKIWFLKSPFALKDEIKAMKGSRWHGFDAPPQQIWSVIDCERNRFQLRCLKGENAYSWFDQPTQHYQYTRPLFDHQKVMADHILTYHYGILAVEMGCISGAAVVHCNRAKRGFKITLRELYEKWSSRKDYQGKLGQKGWDSSVPTLVRSLKDGVLGLHRLVNVLDKGIKPVVKVTLASGKTLVCTPDHEIYTGHNTCVPASILKTGDIVLTNGTFTDKDGYIRVSGLKNCHPSWTTGGIYEHRLVMEREIGRYLRADEIVHHINGKRHDNRIENLEIVSDVSHKSRHGKSGGFTNLDNPTVCFVPKNDTVVSVDPAGEEQVFDLVMDDPHRNFVADGFIVHNCGKTLAAIEVLENSGVDDWWWVGPRSALAAVEEEFEKWDLGVTPQLMTYEGMKKRMLNWTSGDPAPVGVVFDESSRLKGSTSQRTRAAMALADAVRSEHGDNGYVVLMTGTPAPKSPVDWYSQAEVAYPGFLREGTPQAFKFRLGFFKKEKKVDGYYWDKIGWRDNPEKCDICGITQDKHDATHKWLPSRDEVSYLNKRLNGLVVVYNKKDCLDLPDKIYREIRCKPSKSLVKAAKSLVEVAPTAIQALTWIRELSDGFQYKEEEVCTECCSCTCGGPGPTGHGEMPPDSDCDICDGTGRIPIMKRVAKRVKCPKDDAYIDLLDENIEVGRMITFAGFQASIDRIRELCLGQGWDVVQIDGRGWKVFSKDPTDLTPLKYWRQSDQRVVFLAHPASGGMGLTLTEASMAVYYSNDFSPESRSQSEDRGHRPGMDLNKGFTIVDLYNLHTDEYVRNILKENRRLELITLGELKETL